MPYTPATPWLAEFWNDPTMRADATAALRAAFGSEKSAPDLDEVIQSALGLIAHEAAEAAKDRENEGDNGWAPLTAQAAILRHLAYWLSPSSEDKPETR